MPYPMINAQQLQVFPLAERRSYIEIAEEAQDPAAPPPDLGAMGARLDALAERIRAAHKSGAGVMLAYGAHLIKNGGGTLVNALLEAGHITHVATQGAGIIHDWEFSFQGRSSESVRDNAPAGRFGSWDETGRWINLAVLAGASEGLGFGEAMGRLISGESLTLPDPEALARMIATEPANTLTGARADLLWTMRTFGLHAGTLAVPHPHKRYSVPACAYRRRVPFTVHPGIGYDIIVNHPMYHGGAIGRAATTDARIFAASVDRLAEGGVYLSVGSAIMSPQVFEKSFSAANNLRVRSGRTLIRGHHIAVVDLQDGGGWDWSRGEPPHDSPAYYLRYCKSFIRMGGSLDYFSCDNRAFLLNLIARLR